MMSDNKFTYHEIDFLLPAQRFNIQFSYTTHKGLSFIREFLLRLIHVAPMTKTQISTYFGLTRRETDEAISDLVQRGELTLSAEGRLTLTEKSNGYFSGIGQIPQLSTIQDGGANLSFDLATFSCFSNQNVQDKWKAGIPIKVDDSNVSQSEKLIEKHFQYQFKKIIDKGYLPKLQAQNQKEQPSIYTVNSVNKLGHLPLRLMTQFQMDHDGKAVERGDYEELVSSELVHELMTIALSRLSAKNNTMSIFKSMVSLDDKESMKLFDSKTNLINSQFIKDLQDQQDSSTERVTFLGPVYAQYNWDKIQKALAPVLSESIKNKPDVGNRRFIWIAPSDPYWAMSTRFTSSFSNFIERCRTKDKILYSPVLYVPVADEKDSRTAKQWQREFGQYSKYVKGMVEGFLDGNVEILHLENELVAIIYHFNQPENLPVTMPFGFITKNIDFVEKVGKLINDYLRENTSFDKNNDCGDISSIAKSS